MLTVRRALSQSGHSVLMLFPLATTEDPAREAMLGSKSLPAPPLIPMVPDIVGKNLPTPDPSYKVD